MRNWGMLYERQPLQLDAVLLLVALLLHLPLISFHMKAPPKGTRAKPFSRLTNIDFVEEQIKKRKEQPLVLPPKMPEAPKPLQDMAKKMEEVKQQVFKRSLPPPPPPKPATPGEILKGPETGKLQEKLLKDKIAAPKGSLQDKGGFQGKELKLSGPDSKDIKLGGGGAALQAGSRLGAVGGPAGGALQGKSGFQVSNAAAPASIGGGDDLKIGGASNIVVMPTGSRARADASILSPVAKKDRGALAGGGPAGVPSSGGGAAPGLAGPAAAAPIVAGGSRLAAPAPAAVPVKEGKRLENASLPNPLAEPARAPSPSDLNALPRRINPTKVQKPMFLITGPLANRQVVSRVVPEYPEWAREKGVESAVTLQFTVTPEGTVKDNIIVVRTSGYPQLDELARGALVKWKFVELPPDQLRDEVGSITFNFSVR